MQPKSIQKFYNSYGVEKILQFYLSSIGIVLQHWSDQDSSKGWPGDVVSREQPAKGDPETNFGQECNPSPSRSAIIHMVLGKLDSFIPQAFVVFFSTDLTTIAPKAVQVMW